MNIKRLELTNMRALEYAEFDFTTGMNLLVGVNGVGKTTVLDAIRICLSRILPKITSSPSKSESFENESIRGVQPSLTAKLTFEIGQQEFQFVCHQPRENLIAATANTNTSQIREVMNQRRQPAGKQRRQIRSLRETATASILDSFAPGLSVLQSAVVSSKEHPLGVYFSTSRSHPSDAIPPVSKTAGTEAVAYAQALQSRELRLAELAHWMHAQEALASEHAPAKKHLAALQRAAKAFLPECRNLRAENSPKPRLLVDKGKMRLDVRQLSDGERGLFAIVLDLARRLSQANPKLADPVKQGVAIILIDELDLHLHPKWQRTIVEQLTTTFQNCQFIATTHSPQIVAAVEPEHVLLLSDAGVFRPDRTFGMDSNWILRHLMEADDRPLDAAEKIRRVEALINDAEFKKARAAIAKARQDRFDLPEWSIFEARMVRMEILADEIHPKRKSTSRI